MLVLTRKQGEKIQIGENVTITVLRMKGKAVRLGIEAPTELSVLRGELVFDQDDASSKESSESNMRDRKRIEEPQLHASRCPTLDRRLSPKSPPVAPLRSRVRARAAVAHLMASEQS